MSESRPFFRDFFRASLGQRTAGPHPDASQLETFQWGDLNPDARAGIEDHLAICPDCLRAVRVLDEMAERTLPEVTASEGSATSTERDLRSFRRLLHREHLHSSAATADLGGKAGPPWFPAWRLARGPYSVAFALLAALGLAIWGLGSLLTGERIPHRALVSPLPNTPIIDVRGARLRSEKQPEPHPIVLGPEDKLVTLVLEDPQERVFQRYRLDITNTSDETIFAVEGLKRTSYRSFIVTFARRSLPENSYRLELIGIETDTAHSIAAYSILIKEVRMR